MKIKSFIASIMVVLDNGYPITLSYWLVPAFVVYVMLIDANFSV
jgi:hypothetical protein